MLIQNSSSAASAPGLTSNSGPAVVVAPEARAAPKVAVKAATEPSKAAAAEQNKAAPPTPAQLQEAVESINKAMGQINANVEFSIDKETQRTVVKMVESKTGEVLRQYPSEEVLAISRAIDNNIQHGLLIKQKA